MHLRCIRKSSRTQLHTDLRWESLSVWFPMAIRWVGHIFWTSLQISLTFLLANKDHAKLKQNLNRCKGGHEQLVKSYEKLRQDMQDLTAQCNAPIGVNVPAPLNGEKLWDLDIDNDLWVDLARDAQSQDGDAPKWLYDQPMRQGIRCMTELQCCKEEFEWLHHECSALYIWLQGQGKQLRLPSCFAQGKWYSGYFT